MTGFDSKRQMAQDKVAQPSQAPVAWMNNKDFEPIRVRIMQEAYELADRNDSEGYNAIKVMCGDVQRMLPPQRPWVELTEEEMLDIERNTTCEANESWLRNVTCNIEDALRRKNT